MAAAEMIHVFWHDGMLNHRPTPGIFDTLHDGGGLLAVTEEHPENAARVRNIKSILERGPISSRLKWHTGRAATIPELHLFHNPDYVEQLAAADRTGTKTFCTGTCFNPGSWESTLLAAGTTLEAMRYLLNGGGKLAYSLVRPPGHHAQPDRADGYCFINNAGVAVQLALTSGRINRVAVVDIDVHYGNGTAAGFYSSNKVLTISLHMNHGSWGESHPQSGQPEETGAGEGRGFNVNIPLPNGTGDKGYELALRKLVVPRLESFKPELMVVTMGQDASAFDPNGRQCLTMSGYRRLGEILRDEAERHSGGRMLLVQEGGYQLCYTAYCVHATLEGVLRLDKPLLEDPMAYYPEDEASAAKKIEEISTILERTSVFM